jgi:site-specific DNA recombinase
MKRRVIIYTRVSTDEQNNGYSPADQKDKLYKYCQHNDVEIIGFYHDDVSGKSFDRPKWIEIMQFIKKNKGYVDNIYFVKWDRFSRNVAEAYITINNLKKLGVEPQSIEQPLDFEIPESKIMLAVYLAAPEVDNDRRALNIFHGIRRGKKDGRWLGACLRGYINTRDENNRPIIAPEGGKQEELVKRAFSEFATGAYNIEELRKILYKEGLKCNRCSFWKLLRNKGYIGKILVPAYKDEPAQWVDGAHESLINERTFYDVQDIITGRRRNIPNKVQTFRDELPLRGYLICPRCGRILTGSASTGRHGGKFFYYHCRSGCKERQKATLVNQSVLKLIKKYNSKPQVMEMWANILKAKLKLQNASGTKELERVIQEIGKQNQRLKNARELMLDGEFSAGDYKEMKIAIEERLDELRREEVKMRQGIENFDKKIDAILDLLKNIDSLYVTEDVVVKQSIVGSMFPEKLIFKNNKCRTPRVNEVVSLICNDNNGFEGDEKKEEVFFNTSSLRVDPEGVEPSSKKGNC